MPMKLNMQCNFQLYLKSHKHAQVTLEHCEPTSIISKVNENLQISLSSSYMSHQPQTFRPGTKFNFTPVSTQQNLLHPAPETSQSSHNSSRLSSQSSTTSTSSHKYKLKRYSTPSSCYSSHKLFPYQEVLAPQHFSAIDFFLEVLFSRKTVNVIQKALYLHHLFSANLMLC